MRVAVMGGGFGSIPAIASCAGQSLYYGEFKDFTLNITPGTPCSGTPASLAVSPTNPALCSSSTASLALALDASGYTYQWQESSTAGGTYVNVTGGSGATTATYTSPTGGALPYSPTYYRCNVTCTSSGQTTASQISTVSVNPFLNCYCVPSYAAANGTTRGITQIILNGTPNINNTTFVNNVSPYYTSYTAASPVSNAGLSLNTAYTLSVKVGTQAAASNNVGAWVDYNQNGIFETSEFLGSFSNALAISMTNINFTVPGTAATGTTGMRVRHRYGAAVTSADACTNFTGTAGAGGAGETEDYRVNITGNSCSGTPTAGTASASISSVCPNATSILSLSGYTSGVSGITFQWQLSVNGGGYANVSGGTGATTATYTTPAQANATLTTATYAYQCIVTCTNSGLSATSTSTTVTVNPSPSVSVTPNTSSICNGGGGQVLTASNAASGTTTFTWLPTTGLSPTSGSSVTSAPGGNTTYTVTATANSCTGSATAVITVNPTTLTFSPSASTIGVGGSVSITASATSTNAGAITYAWAPSTGLSATSGATVTASPLSTTTYTVTATDGSGCSRTGTVTVSVSSGTPGTVSCGYAYSYGNPTSFTTASSLGTPTSLTWADDAVYSNNSIGFNFNFNDFSYSTMGISSNGFIWFGTGTPSATNYTPLSTTTGQTGAVDGIISVFGQNLLTFQSGLTSLKYVTFGSVGSRTCVVEWNAAGIDQCGVGGGGDRTDFQIRLYEGSNIIELWYKDAAYDLTYVGSCGVYSGQVGIRGATVNDYQNRTNGCEGPWASTSAGSSNSSGMSIGGGWNCAASWPGTGNNFRYTPTAKPTINPSAQQNICTGGAGVTLTAVNSGSMSSPSYQWQSYTYPPSNTDVAGQTAITYLANAITAGNYFYTVKLTSGACVRYSDATAVVAASCCTPPVFTACPGTISLSAGTGACHTAAIYSTPVTGTSPILSYTFTGATTGSGNGNGSGSDFNVGTTTVTVTATNGCGNPLCSFDVMVSDNELPTITAPSDVTVCNGASITLGTPSTGDNCGVATVTNNAPGSYSVGTTVVTWIVTDIHGNTATATQNVIVNALPSANISASNGLALTCANPNTVLSVPTPGGTTQVWSQNGLFFATASNPLVTVGATYDVTVTVTATGCTANSSVTTTLNNTAPDATISASNGLTFCDGSSTVLSVPVTGTTSQVWNQNGVFFATASNPVITVGAIYNVTVTDGANGCTTSSSVTTVANPLPIGSASNIVICNGDPSNVPLNSTEVGSTFTWTSSVTTGGIIGNNDCTSGCGNAIADVLTNTGYVHGVVTYTVIPTSGLGCTGAPFTANVTVGAAPSAPVISGPNALCGITSTVYTVAAVPEATSYVWTVPTGVTGMTITSGQGTTALHVTISAGTVSGDVTCTASNSCGSSLTTILPVTKKPAVPGAITGPTSTCGQTSATYSIAPVFGATSYIWTLPAGMTASGAANLNTITVNIAGTFIYGQVKVSAVNACGNVPGIGIWITGNAPNMPLTLSGPANVCGLTTGTYSIPAVAGASGYNWTITGAGNSISGSNTGTTATAILAGPGTISVAATNLCGSSTNRTLTLVTTALQPGAISGPANTCGLTIASYSVATVANASIYTWGLATGMTWGTGQGTNVITVNIAPSVGSTTAVSPLKVSETNTCGNTSLYRTTSITRCLSPDALNTEGGNTFSNVYPNPTSSEFTMDVTVDKDQEIVLEVFDILCNIVISEKHMLATGTSTMKTNMEPFNNGMYFVRILDATSNVIHTERVVKQ